MILRNRAYIGEYRWGEHVIPGGMPQIISVELFDAAFRVNFILFIRLPNITQNFYAVIQRIFSVKILPSHNVAAVVLNEVVRHRSI